MSDATVYEFQGAHRFLSNFWPCSVVYAGLKFPSVEHAYQAAKCTRFADRTRFLLLTPGAARQWGRRVVCRDDWKAARVAVMADLLRQKFAPGTALAEKLMATGCVVLQEGNWWGDTFWGVSLRPSGKLSLVGGQNKLGVLLMEIRAGLKGVVKEVTNE